MDYEPGPVPPPTLGQRPVVTISGLPLEQLVANHAPEFSAVNDALVVQHQSIVDGATIDIETEFALVVGPAEAEVVQQFVTPYTGDQSRVDQSLLTSVMDVDGEMGQHPSPSAVPQLPPVPEPGDSFEPGEPGAPAPPPEPPAPPNPEPIITKVVLE